MEVTVLEHEKTHLKISIKGETRTLANLICKELWNDSAVKAAGFHLLHPQTSDVVIVLDTEKKDAKKVFLNTLDVVKKKSVDFHKSFKKVAK